MEQTKPEVLIVEDDLDLQYSLRANLEEEGFVVHTANNGAEAFQVLSVVEKLDVILLDLLMPVMDGWQFLKAWQERRTKQNIPVVALSAVSYRGAPGAVAVVPKPVDFDALIRLIHQVRRGTRWPVGRR